MHRANTYVRFLSFFSQDVKRNLFGDVDESITATAVTVLQPSIEANAKLAGIQKKAQEVAATVPIATDISTWISGPNGKLQPPPPSTPRPATPTATLRPAAAAAAAIPPPPNPPTRTPFTLNPALLNACKSALKAPAQAKQHQQQPLMQTPQRNQSLLDDGFSKLMSARRQTVAPSSKVSSVTSETWSI
jgi:hypothetical protein